jgi:hypothetical protein
VKEASADHSYYDYDCDDYYGTSCGCDLDHHQFDSGCDRTCCTTAEEDVEVEDVHVRVHEHVRVHSNQSTNVREHGTLEAVHKAHHWKAAEVVADMHLN